MKLIHFKDISYVMAGMLYKVADRNVTCYNSEMGVTEILLRDIATERGISFLAFWRALRHSNPNKPMIDYHHRLHGTNTWWHGALSQSDLNNTD